ncbi:3-hydroxy-9,10-secoandrosta-1,3,5(10)-triene-9,17-dione monooxygenase oxygenase subunit [Streptosporangium saharense]|uniref:3-hydroxy-9,10-secoandrosta-1,3,5(10)-triene-9, 17-dione monooxygenase n=1 Tax=Streptosporangium saharense TaxID=1706840 RepID=A0A7W7QHG9_9ACTN|nr:3-hydroxy-9,10-secoandrosta-1,3,5(10)-triene-9,17-dione monooxygenase oxygenase subunit [Streptosporangium saharense]MBB4913675.1 3-hydroxy-9,10-secoandrosta-1,3,5(10)-triene-9,17-dione monooxygenase [Streptosporangium saharense]
MSEHVLTAIRDLLPVLRERAQATEDARVVPTESIKELREAGFFRLLQPTRFGGHEADPVTFYTAVRLISSACGSTGWVSSVLGAHAWHVATFPAEAQEELWGQDPAALVSSAYAPVGRATAVDGGYRLSGTWNFSSGVNHASAAILGALIMGEDGRPADWVAFLVPREDYAVHDVWRTVGLRGTGSNDVVVEDAFVPAHRVLSFADSFRCVCPGQEVNPGPLYRIPLYSLMTTTIATPLVGMATGAYEAHVAHQRRRVRVFAGEKVKDDPFAKVRVARAASEVDAAWLQLTRNITEIYDTARRGEPIPTALRLRLRRDQVRASERCIAAVDQLFENSGAGALAEGTPIQRFWRDAHAARVHVANDPEAALKLFGDGEFGEDVTVGML